MHQLFCLHRNARIDGNINLVYLCCILVCIRFLNNFTKRMKESGIDSSSPDHVEIEFLKACREAKGKDERFVSNVFPPLMMSVVLCGVMSVIL